MTQKTRFFRELIVNHIIPATDPPVAQPAGGGGAVLAAALEQVRNLKLLPERMENRMIPTVAPKEGHTAFLALLGDAVPTYELTPVGDAVAQTLALIRLIRDEGGSFVSPTRHAGLWSLLNQLEQAAEKARPEGEKSAAAEEAARAFTAALEQTMSLADQIARRDNETAVMREQAARVRNRFTAIRDKMR